MRYVVDLETGEVTEHDDLPVVTPTIEEQLFAIERDFATKKMALAAQLATVTLIDGPDEEIKIAELRVAYVAACNNKEAAIDALLFGEL